MRIVTPAEYSLEMRMRKSLESFPLYRPSHWVLVCIEDSNHICIGYGPTPNRRINKGETIFDLEIKKRTCDILHFFISGDERRKGYGRRLYQTIEEFARNLGCRRLVTSPSGQGLEFWPKMGFRKPIEGGFQKSLYDTNN